ncbi:MAG: hypothetical protein ACI8PZ_007144 [Myxococcota bacterium]
MFDTLNERIAEAEAALERRATLAQRLRVAEDTRVRAREALAYCEEQAEREQQDIRALDGLPGLWSRLTGTYEERAEHEAREAYQALRRLDQAKAVLSAAEEAYLDIAQGFDATDHLETEFERLIAHKSMRLQQSDRPEKAAVNALDNDIVAREALLDELEETLALGQSALAALAAVAHKLELASHQGVMDQTGMPLAGVNKQLNLRSATELMTAADGKHQAFFVHLGILDTMGTQRTELGVAGTAIADLAFDGMLTDMWVQGRITDAARTVESRREEVRMAVGQIADQRGRAAEGLRAAETTRIALIRDLR